ncbi:MAG: transcription repressor NadR [Lachnospiraceae bacterium]|nr:transcription repressor NadR [Lachnospiraceae bacterium]
MDGDSRKKEIVKLLQAGTQPISGTELAKKFGVTRQIIVQDIALLRANDKNILSTNKGYVLFVGDKENEKYKRTFKVYHREDKILNELFTIVDLGGSVLDVVVEHPIYGQIMVDLIINSRLDAENFVEQVKEYRTKPLTDLTEGVHFHTVTAPSQSILDAIEIALDRKGYLIK